MKDVFETLQVRLEKFDIYVNNTEHITEIDFLNITIQITNNENIDYLNKLSLLHELITHQFTDDFFY